MHPVASRFDWRPTLALVASSALWGVYWLPHRALAEAGLGGTWAAVAEYACAVLILVPIALWRLRRGRRMALPGLLPGVLMGTAFVLYANGVVLTTVANALLLFYLAPVWATLLEFVVLRAPVRPSRMLAIALGLGGLWVLTAGEAGLPNPDNLGDWLSLGSGMVGATALLVMRRRTGAAIFDQVFAFNALGVVLALASVPIATGTFVVPSVAGIDPIVALWGPPTVLLLMIVASAGTMWAAARMDPGRAGILMMTDVVVGLAFAAALTDEPFGQRQVLATCLIIGAGLVEVLVPLARSTQGSTP